MSCSDVTLARSCRTAVYFASARLKRPRQTAAAPVCVCVCVPAFMSFFSVYVQRADSRSLVRLLWVLRAVDFWSGFVYVFFRGGVMVSVLGPCRQLRGSDLRSVAKEGRPSGITFRPPPHHCATICGEWRGPRPRPDYSSKGS